MSSPPPLAASRERGGRGATRTSVLEALVSGGAMTAAEVAVATGLSRATVSSTLSRMSRTGEVTKAERGYQLPNGGSNSSSEPTRHGPKPEAPTASAPTVPAKPPSSRTKGRAGRGAGDATTPARTAPGATKAKVLAALSTDGGLTAGEVARATGLGRATVSTTLSKLAKTGEVVKAERGYKLAEP